MKYLVAVVALASLASCAPTHPVPVWPSTFQVNGSIILPYAEIYEPFSTWMDGTAGAMKMRTDLYHGTTKMFTMNNSNHNLTDYQVVPVSNKMDMNKMTCFAMPSGEGLLQLGSPLPDLTGFTFVEMAVCGSGGKMCEVWTLTRSENHGNKINRYSFYGTRDAAGNVTPVFYEMQGYDTLYGSHFDQYFVVYQSYSTAKPNANVFMVPDRPCHSLPNDTVPMMNPLRELVSGHTQHIKDAFETFKTKHGKIYVNPVEEDERYNKFMQNYRYIESTNRRDLSFKVKVNHLADMSEDEIRVMRGRKQETKQNRGLPFNMEEEDLSSIPNHLDWRIAGAVTPVQDQAVCGSCWSFGSSESIEGAQFLKHGILKRLSSQNLMDCTWAYGNDACDGGFETGAYDWIIDHGGIMTEEEYGRYSGADGMCHFNKSLAYAQVKSYVNVTSMNLTALKVALANHGPVAVDVDAAHKSFSFYSHGIYSDPHCGNRLVDLDHSVLAVGYGTFHGQKYWLVKNSWSTHWGDAGYVLYQQKNNMCGVATSPTYVNVV